MSRKSALMSMDFFVRVGTAGRIADHGVRLASEPGRERCSSRTRRASPGGWPVLPRGGFCLGQPQKNHLGPFLGHYSGL